MQISENQNHHLITIYGDTKQQEIHNLVAGLTPEKDTRILSPTEEEALLQASQNSSLIIIGIHHNDDPNFRMAKALKDNRLVVADIMALTMNEAGLSPNEAMAQGFDLCLCLSDCKDETFRKILKQRVVQGSRRLSGLILEEEYRRFSDALSSAPTSVIVFDQDKRIVFVSEHYFRAYPQSAPRLIRGLSVFDAFDMMSREEKLSIEDERYDSIRQFWYSLTGDIEFTLDNGISYRLKATALPNERGTIVTAQNITEYVRQNKELKKALQRLKEAEEKN